MSARIWIARDGMVTTRRVDGQDFDHHDAAHEAWCDVVKDALLARRWEEVYRMLEKHDSDELTCEPEIQDYTMCVACVPTVQDAQDIIVRFCKLGYGSHPLLAKNERWYYLPGFCDSVEGLKAVTKMFEDFHRLSLREKSRRRVPHARK